MALDRRNVQHESNSNSNIAKWAKPQQAPKNTFKPESREGGRWYEAEAEADPLMSTVKASHSGAMQHEIPWGISIDC